MLCSVYEGPALMAVCSKALPLTASGLSPLPAVGSRFGHVRKPVLEVRRWFSPGALVSSTTYNW